MTDREKLVDIVCGAMQGVCVEHCNHQPCYCVATIADALIANGVTVQEWISVEERMPENGVDVLVCNRRSNVFVATVCNSEYFLGGLTWRDQTGYMLGLLGITHWMPLPEPPKEE